MASMNSLNFIVLPKIFAVRIVCVISLDHNYKNIKKKSSLCFFVENNKSLV